MKPNRLYEMRTDGDTILDDKNKLAASILLRTIQETEWSPELSEDERYVKRRLIQDMEWLIERTTYQVRGLHDGSDHSEFTCEIVLGGVS